MAYKAPLAMRIFHYALWAFMLFLLAWFLLIPIFLRVTTPEPTLLPDPSADAAATSAPGADSSVPVQQPTPAATTP
ncbi:MAG TPA: hypothetical protein VL017_08270 [Devosia sp.]|nr:hypothetical protein [Devosia sp.]